jgi:hypothetical protein
VLVPPTMYSVGVEFFPFLGVNRENPKSANLNSPNTLRILSGLMSACHLNVLAVRMPQMQAHLPVVVQHISIVRNLEAVHPSDGFSYFE